MMAPRTKFALALALLWGVAVGVVGLGAAAFWADLDDAERSALAAALEPRAPLLILVAVGLALAFAAVLHRWFAAYPAALLKAAEQVRLVHTVNPSHRLDADGADEVRRLADATNELAAAHEALRRDVDARVNESNERLQQEKNLLAALMSQLAQSVLVCNAAGRILLYNERATQLLDDGAGDTAPVGLGRSIFGILDRNLMVHALDKIRQRLAQKGPEPVAQFVTTRGGQLLRAQVAPVLDAAGALTGFVLVLADITRTVEIGSRHDFVLQQLTGHTRASLASIRAAVETVQQYPGMAAERRQRLIDVIDDEARKLSLHLDETLARLPAAPSAPWPAEDMLADDLLAALQRNLETTLGVIVQRARSARPLWLSVDSYALVQALTFVVAQLKARFGVRAVAAEAAAEGGLARLSLRWSGPALDPALLHEWEQQPYVVAGGGSPTLRDVLERHGAELWCRPDRAGGENRLAVELPPAAAVRPAPALDASGSRPVYYDFDLFHQPGQSPELDERPLAELTYTVFDTETTGLSPSEGDEIISIGAVRIVNGRLRANECFDRLVNPRRPVPSVSQRVHGLSGPVLADQPGIEQVLPAFHRFAEDTVLVAHNAAFDMRFLQLKEETTGVRFIQPVLDTLLLSALVHPGHADAEHQLEQIAARLGVPVIGRHTALGDAMVTAEIFLKLVPLLAERGIRTLGQAREASQKTLYAKLEY